MPKRTTARELLGMTVFLAVFSLGIASCSETTPPQVGAERFIDRYYVEIDLVKAMPFAVGLARAKLEEEQQLLDGIEGAQAAGKPDVYYRFLEAQPGSRPDRTGLLYELTIRFGGGDPVVRRTLVTVVDQGGGDWKVANFREMD